jgi:hypothetical protein
VDEDEVEEELVDEDEVEDELVDEELEAFVPPSLLPPPFFFEEPYKSEYQPPPFKWKELRLTTLVSVPFLPHSGHLAGAAASTF